MGLRVVLKGSMLQVLYFQNRYTDLMQKQLYKLAFEIPLVDAKIPKGKRI
jgi:hypothetical protein